MDSFLSSLLLVCCGSGPTSLPSYETKGFLLAEHYLWKCQTAMKVRLVCLMLCMVVASVGAVKCQGVRGKSLCDMHVVSEAASAD